MNRQGIASDNRSKSYHDTAVSAERFLNAVRIRQQARESTGRLTILS